MGTMRLVMLSLLICPLLAAAQDMYSDAERAAGASAERVRDLMRREAVQWPATPNLDSKPAGNAPRDASLILRETARAEDAATRLTALEGLAAAGVRENIDAFVDALRDPAPEVRRFSAYVLNQTDPTLFFEKILYLLNSNNGTAGSTTEVAVPLLRDSLETPFNALLLNEAESVDRRITAAGALALMKSQQAATALAQVANSTNDPKLARACVTAMGAIPDAVVVPQLVRLMAHSAPEVRYAVLNALAAAPGLDATAALAEIAGQPNPTDAAITVQAVTFLAQRQDPQVVPMLIQVMSQNPEAVGSAVSGLRRITGEDYGDNAELWRQWWQRKQQKAMEPPHASPFNIQMMD